MLTDIYPLATSPRKASLRDEDAVKNQPPAVSYYAPENQEIPQGEL